MEAEDFELLLFGLDGTLLGSDLRIRPASVRALEALQQRGLRVGFATRRDRRSVQPYLDALSATGPCILLNGGLLWDPQSRSPIVTKPLARASAIEFLNVLSDAGVAAIVDYETVAVSGAYDPASPPVAAKDGVEPTEVADLVGYVAEHEEPPLRIVCAGHDADFEILSERLRAIDEECTLVHNERRYLEVLGADVSKGTMLDELESACGMSHRAVLAFGDDINDVEVLRRAGRAVVMGNASVKLRRLVPDADFIGGHNTDAIAKFLRDLFRL